VILTGTPEGVGPIRAGQVLTASIPGVVKYDIPVALKQTGLTQQFFGRAAPASE
jgi:2-keto-4-pentenoate hydratase/2-oxohepta-3-ene-1,7-dioic acid hydratase in catechol pathway